MFFSGAFSAPCSHCLLVERRCGEEPVANDWGKDDSARTEALSLKLIASSYSNFLGVVTLLISQPKAQWDRTRRGSSNSEV